VAVAIETARPYVESASVPAALRLQGLCKVVKTGFWARRVEILRGVDLTVADGDVFGLLGPNGAGKTTTLKVVLGLMRATSGSVELTVPREQIGYLPENPYFYDYLTGEEFLRFSGRLFEVPAEVREARVRGLLGEVGLEDAAGTHLRKYSKGMLQRVGIAQALVNDPSLVLLDEPMTGLDPIGRVEVKSIIEGLRRRGKTVLFNSHILSDVAELCTRIAIMKAGVVVWEGSVESALAESGDLERFFVRQVSA
jgi:ABC-2 type transport system ATP-binding protein